MKKQYNSPQTTFEPFEPLLLDVNPGSGNGGEYQGGMDVDAPRRGDLDNELAEELNQRKDEWVEGLW